MKRHGSVVFLCCLLLAAACGCGRKTPPIPPQAAIPKAIADLSCQLDDQGGILRWTYPVLAESGEKIERVRTFQLYKSEMPAADFCADCPVHYGRAITLSADDAEPGDTMTYRDSDLQEHYRYTYKVVAGSGWNIASSDSNRVSFRWERPLPPPAGLALQAGDQRLTLTWQPVTHLPDGTAVDSAVRYQVYRSEKGRNFSPLGAPVDGLSYRDEGLVNRRTYSYQVRAVRRMDDTELPGEASAAVSGAARSEVPPEPPQQFTLVATAEGVKILWENVAQPEVAGFRIYRRTAAEQQYTLVGETDRASFSFMDRNLPEGEEPVYYAVTAIDDAVPPRESAFSREVEFRR
jgi:fibronectin type 3 domain-containing protein